MNLLKLSAAVLNTTPLDWDGNQRTILAAVAEARRQGVAILCLPELCISGYGCEDAFHSPGTSRTAWETLGEILPHTRGLAVSLGLPVLHQNGIFNCAAMCIDGRVAGLVAKRFLAGDGIHYEPRWFKPWPGGIVSQVVRDGVTIPLGDLHFDISGVRVGFEICEDAWVAQRPGGALAREGVDVILNPSASHFAFGKLEVRKRFVIEGSRAFGVTYVYANLVGNEAGRAIYDGGALIASGGRLLASGPRFTYADYHLTSAVVDLDATRMSQARTASFTPDLAENPNDRIRVSFALPPAKLEVSTHEQAAWELGSSIKEEEFTRAETLALWDYMRKSRSRGFVVSLSGGADSSAVSVLIHTMARLVLAELGAEQVKEKLAYIPDLPAALDPPSLTRRLLTTVYQATANSGPVTRSAARAVAQAIHAHHLEFDIDAQVKGYIAIVEQSIGCVLNWQRDDIALQNIQARARSPGVWMLANINNALLLATSNRSEAAVGYATMDGDTSGGLSPIAGIDKNFLRHWLRWYESAGPHSVGALPALSAVNRQAPTAELRPAASRQTDEDDLMPYDVLDAIERSAIRDKRTPLEVFQLMRAPFPQYSAQQLGVWIERFYKLWCRNQWKRERYAPSFHLDDENLDPKTWCRFPILSGNYEKELGELRRHLQALV